MKENEPYLTSDRIKKIVLILIVVNCLLGLFFLFMTVSGHGFLYEWFVNNGYATRHVIVNLSNVTYIKIIE